MKADAPRTVQLFVTCLIETLRPEAGMAVVRVLEALGLEVEFPKAQTCCGQPAFNGGAWDDARAMGRHVKAGVALCYAVALGGWAGALWNVRPDALVLVALIPAALHLTGQVVTLDLDNGADALAKFRSNRFAGLLVFAAMLVVGSAP